MPTFFNRNIPDEAHTKMGQIAKYHIQVFAFTPSNGWVIVTADGRLFARNIPEECYQKLNDILKARHKIRCIAFPFPGGNRWVIVTNRAYYARNIPNECFEKMGTFATSKHQLWWIGFPPDGGNRWVIVTNRTFFARNIADECYQIIRNLYQGPRAVQRVMFTPTGGWLVLAQDYFFARNIPEECFQTLKSFDQRKWINLNVVFSPRRGGWSIIANSKWQTRPVDKIRTVENRVVRINNQWQSLWQILRVRKVPGLALAVIMKNRVVWETGYGHLRKGKDPAVHPESVFQAASISKFVTAVGVLRLVQQGRVGLDQDVRPLLNWPLPKRACMGLVGAITVRRLLTHNAGIIGRNTTTPSNRCSNFNSGGGGFAGYANRSGVRVPSLLQVLNGSPSFVNSPRAEVTHRPGSRFSYAGAGFIILQRLVEQLTKTNFAQWFRLNVFDPLGMDTSTFALGPPFSLSPPHNVAAGHKTNGNMISGERNRYPESAAAGLYTTPIDLARIIIMLNCRGRINRERFLRASLVDDMLESQSAGTTVGLGCFFGGSGTKRRYGHNGSNYGFKCTLYGYPQQRAGVVVLTNGDDGQLPEDVASAVIRTYGW